MVFLAATFSLEDFLFSLVVNSAKIAVSAQQIGKVFAKTCEFAETNRSLPYEQQHPAFRAVGKVVLKGCEVFEKVENSWFGKMMDWLG